MASATGTASGLSRRGFLAGSAGFGAAVLLGGCGNRTAHDLDTVGSTVGMGEPYTGPPVELDFWTGFTGGDGPPMRALIDSFNAEHPNITVEMNTVRWLEFYPRVPAAVIARKGPDLAVMHIEQLATSAARRVVLPLDDVVTDLGLQDGDFPEQVWDAGVYQGRRYGIPLDMHCLAQYANNGLLQQAGIDGPPADAEQLEASFQALRSAVPQPFWMPVQWPAHLIFLSLLWQYGGEPYAADGSAATFAEEPGVQALSWMREQVARGVSPANLDLDAQYTAFKNAQNALTWDGIWQINDVRASAPDVEWSLTPLPQVGPEPGVWASSHQFVIMNPPSRNDDKLQAGATFIGWVSERSQQWAKAGMIPARTSARESAEFRALTEQAVAARQIPDMHFLPTVPGLAEVQAQVLELAVQQGLIGTSPEQALGTAAEQASELMQQNLKKFKA